MRMENNMKRLLIFLTFIFCVGFVSAQTAKQLLNQIGRAPVKTVKPKGEMRIFQKDGEEVLVNFPSNYLNNTPKIHVVFPSQTYERRPSIYLISDNELDKSKIQEMYPDFFGKYFFITVMLEEGENNFSKFLTSELLPYIEVNYFVYSNPEERTLIAKNSFALDYLANLKNISYYLKNAAISFDYSSPMPAIEATTGLNLWAEGPVDNVAALHASLVKQNLVYLKDFAYNVTKNNNVSTSVNLNFLFNKDGRKITKTTIYQQFKTLDLNKDFASLFWLNLKSKDGYNLAYIPQDVRIAPPLLNWNKEQATFNIISGASVGQIKIDGKTEFGKKFKAKFDIINSKNQAQKPEKSTKNK